MLPHTFRKSTMIDVRHHEAAQHEKDVDGKIALADDVTVWSEVEIGKVLSSPAIVIKNDPERGDAAQRRQRRKRTIGRAGGSA